MTNLSTANARSPLTDGDAASIKLSNEEFASFWEKGFLVLDRPVVSEACLAVIERTLAERPPYSQHDNLRQARSMQPVVDSLRMIAAQLLNRTRPVCHFDHAIVKPSGLNTGIPWHQDQASARIRPLSGRSVHLWIPLESVTPENGCMSYIPLRPAQALLPHRPLGGEGKFEALGVDTEAAVTAPMKRGGVAIHLPLTLHSSSDNLSGQDRRAWVVKYGHGFGPRLHSSLTKYRVR